jgi:DNA polymerase IIIc chi subunit
VIIFVPNQQAASYIDHLLWKSPSDSFLPHAVTSSNTRQRVVITEEKSNLNSAKVALNLTSVPCPALGTFEKVYELWDQTDSVKAQNSNSKMEHYRQLGIF